MLTDALIRTRGAIVDDPPNASRAVVMPPVGSAESITRWSADIRRHVLLFDLIAALGFSVAGPTACG